uniref:RING-type domain-containing protein n=1 Tax=Chaetoceros debilis TaxID=122233 RepID=A0A6S8YSM8_9STRA
MASEGTLSRDISTSLRCKQCDGTVRGLRALSCHHILCKICRRALKVRECPICQEAITNKLRRYDADHDSFKPIEALDMITTGVKFEFFCASNALIGRKILNPSQIVKACNSYKRDEQEYEGYLWRFKGDKKKISTPNSRSSKGIPIEQVSLESGEIIEAFTSLQKAVEKTGVSRTTIKRVLDGKGEANGGGFFWRLKGNNNGPSAYPAPTMKDPVASIPCVQISKVKNREVIHQFRTPRDAQDYINGNENFKKHYSWSQICQWCREEDYKLGFYWKYERSGEDTNPVDAIIGTRIRVFQGGNEWIQGFLDSYDSETGRHKIKYDCGKCEEHKLEDIQYDLEIDQGRDVALPVEQVDVKTGKILASFNSALEAAFAAGEESESYILAVCEGQKRSCHGYFWRFKGSSTKQTKLEVQQLCFETGEVIATFETILAASRAVGVSSQGISNCCDGSNRSKSAGGFGWRFAIDEEEVVMVD